jgi:hypothetical protein
MPPTLDSTTGTPRSKQSSSQIYKAVCSPAPLAWWLAA